MNIEVFRSKIQMGKAAAEKGAALINEKISSNGSANIILATGASQFEMLEALVKVDVDWSKVICFHLDEYIGIDDSHPASFRKYLKERFYELVDVKEFHFINAESDPERECERLNKIIENYQIDVAFIGIGENGHLAFNDPPADFETEDPYIIVDLDEKCRMQQYGEGWFNDLQSVPKSAVSMSIKQIMKSGSIICTVPDERKTEAVKKTIYDPVSPLLPATILRNREDVFLFLDEESASLLKKNSNE